MEINNNKGYQNQKSEFGERNCVSGAATWFIGYVCQFRVLLYPLIIESFTGI